MKEKKKIKISSGSFDRGMEGIPVGVRGAWGVEIPLHDLIGYTKIDVTLAAASIFSSQLVLCLCFASACSAATDDDNDI